MNSIITKDRLDVIARFVRETSGLDGAMAELGVYRGGSAKVILDASADDHRILCLFDTFSGLPSDGGNHKKGDFSADIPEVLDTLGRSMIDATSEKSRLYIYKGEFRYSLYYPTGPNPVGFKFSFVHIDADLYESTRDAIAFFWPRMISGGAMVFDDVDWPDCPGVNQALAESGLMGGVERFAEYQGVIRKT